MSGPASAPRLVQRVPFIERASAGRRVLHLGCTNWPYTAQALDDGSLLHLKLLARAAELHGLDGDREGLATLAARGITNLHHGDLEHLEAVDLDGPFDVIVAGEIIEHLSNPALFLRGVRRWMGPSSVLLLTTVNAYCAFRMVQYGLRGRGGTREPVHPDHVAYYSYATLTTLLRREGFDVRSFDFYDLGTEHRPYTRAYVRWVNDLATRLSPQLADGLVVCCGHPGGADERARR
jgi:SAM-dependent methyltransferase